MARLACVDLPAFRLQILLARRPGWVERPVVVVESESPAALVIEANDPARAAGVTPGMRLAAALGLVTGLRAGTVTSGEVSDAAAVAARRLSRFSPSVEIGGGGTFWLDLSGLGGLFRTPAALGRAVIESLAVDGLRAVAVIGFTRLGTLALARSGRGVRVLHDPGEEWAAAREVPLSCLGVAPATLRELARLGKRTLGDLLDLPASGLLERFGPELHALALLAAGKEDRPLRPLVVQEEIREALALDHPLGDSAALLFAIKRLLAPLLARLAGRHEVLAGLSVILGFGRGRAIDLEIRPAAPTLDQDVVLDLAHLRLDSLARHGLEAGVTEVSLLASAAPAVAEQIVFPVARPRRDLAAAGRALARLRADLGDDAVVRAVTRDGHLPEARFSFEPLAGVALPRPATPRKHALVRRILARPTPLQPRPICGPRGCHLTGMGAAPSDRVHGPYVVSGGWWAREVHREYVFAEGRDGRTVWAYFDRRRRMWFLQGEVD